MDNKGFNRESMASLKSFTARDSLASLKAFTPTRSVDMFAPSELIQAARHGDFDKVHEQIHYVGRDKKRLNTKDSDQTTALHYAVRYGHLDIVKLLVLKGANINAVGDGGATPLHYAARYEKNGHVSSADTPEVQRRKEVSTKNFRDIISNVMKKKKPKRKVSMPSVVSMMINKAKVQAEVVPEDEEETDRETQGNLEQDEEGIEMKNMKRSESDDAFLSSLGNENASCEYDKNKGMALKKKIELSEENAVSQREMPIIKKPIPQVRSRSSYDFTTLVEEDEEDEDDPNDEEKEKRVQTTLTQIVKKWKEKSFAEKKAYRYRYEGSNLEIPDKDKLIITTDTQDDDAEIIRTIDALILPGMRKESLLESASEFGDLRKKRSCTIMSTCCNSTTTEGNATEDNDESPAPNDQSSTDHIEKQNDCNDFNVSCVSTENSSTNEEPEKASVLKFLLKHKANVNARDSFGSTPLHYAAMRGNTAAVKQLVFRKETNFDAKDRALTTALHISASHGYVDACKLLLDAGCNMKFYDSNNLSALHLAAMEGHVNVAELLIKHAEKSDEAADIAAVVYDQDIALHLAVENGHLNVAKFLIEKGANVNFMRGNFVSLLHIASRYGQLDIVKLLVDNGSDIDAKDGSMASPLHTATLFNRFPVVQYLVNTGAFINCCDKDKETPLKIACRKGYTDIAAYLLDRNADATITDIRDRTCLYFAAEENCVSVCELLLQHHSSRRMLEEVEKNGNTALHVASKKGHTEIAQMLVYNKASIHTKNDANLTPLHLASQNGMSIIVEILLKENNRIVNDEDDTSNTPLHLAALEGHVKVVDILLKSGAAVDSRNALLWTPLDCAASRGWVKCAESLLDANALVEPMDKQKATPLHLACKVGHVAVIELLIARGADTTRKDHLGANCLDWAIDNKQRDAAIAILQTDQWENVLRSCTIEGNEQTTPMRKMIAKLPEVAEVVFDKCMTGNGLPKDHPAYEVTFNYEFLDDTFAVWGPYQQHCKKTKEDEEKIDESSRSIETSEIPLISFSIPRWLKRKRNEGRTDHPLQYMVQGGETKLLSHQLVTHLLRYKWLRFGRFVYYTHLMIYLMYLMFVTGYVLTVIADDYHLVWTPNADNKSWYSECLKKNSSNYYSSPSRSQIALFDDFGSYAIVIISIFLFALEGMKFLTDNDNNANYHAPLKILSYFLSFAYVLMSLDFEEGSPMEYLENWRCDHTHKCCAAIVVWIAWVNLVIFIRVFPKLGIYVVMFMEISKTCLQCFPIVFLFVNGFGLGFHIMLNKRLVAQSYKTPLRAIGKTFVGMLNEFEYDDFFNNKEEDPPSLPVWILYFLYIVINCIILMNMLVGLAVDDIKGVQEQAALKRIGIKVDHTLDVERILPISYQKKYLKLEETVVVNKVSTWDFWSFWKTNTSRRSNKAIQMNYMETIMKQQDQLMEHMRSLKNKVRELELANGRKEALIESLTESLAR